MRLAAVALFAVACGGAPAPAASPPAHEVPPTATAWTLPAGCTEEGRAAGAFLTAGARLDAVLIACVTNTTEHEHGGTETEMEAVLVLLEGGVEVRREQVTTWSDGWEWGASWSLVGTRPGADGRDALELH